MGMVAANAHHNGNARSASRPRIINVAQKTFLCMRLFYRRVTPAKLVARLVFRFHRLQQPFLQHGDNERVELAKNHAHSHIRLGIQAAACVSKKSSLHKNFHEHHGADLERLGHLEEPAVRTDLRDASRKSIFGIFQRYLGLRVEREPESVSSLGLHGSPFYGKPNVNSALPAATAMYCLPSTANDIGEEYTDAPH